MDEKVLEEIQFHQDVIERDSNSPLYQIREKEIEISGRVLAAKKKAETIVAEARRKSAETVNKAESAGSEAAKAFEKTTIETAEKDAAAIREGVSAEIAELQGAVEARVQRAVEAVVEAVVTV